MWRRASSLRGPRASRRASAFSRAVQHFSSSPQTKPSVVDGLDGIMQFANRCMNRLEQMDRYREHSVFPPDNFMAHNYVLFNKLQLPTNTEIDAVEFLNGARFACDLAVHTMYSPEFMNFACGAIAESRAAEHLSSGMSPECYEAFLFAMKETSKTGNRFHLKQLDINGVYLSGVDWDRMSLADLKQEEALAALKRAQVAVMEKEAKELERRLENGENRLEAVKSVGEMFREEIPTEPEVEIEPEDYATMVERLRLDVLLDSVEHLEITSADAVEPQTMEKKAKAIWRFESLVTQPEDVDWRITSVY